MKAAIFDLDNTLVDTLSLHKKAYELMLEKYEIAYDKEKLRKIFGIAPKDIVHKIIEENNITIDPKKFHDEKQTLYLELSKGKIELLPGVLHILEVLKSMKVKMAVASGGTKTNVYDALRSTGIEHFFDVVYTGCEIENGKPNPEIFQKVAKELNVLPKDCIVFEDSIYGITAAKDAGMIAIAIATGVHTKEELEHADNVYSEMSEFLEELHIYFKREEQWVKLCLLCKSENVTLFVGGHTGTYICKDCGYVGLPFEVQKD